MYRYILKKVASLIPVLIGISLIAFILGVISPGDPAEIALSQGGMSQPTAEQIESLREEMGLNDPLPVQYLSWMKNALRGDLGVSYVSNEPVGKELRRRLPVTLKLALYAMAITCSFGILLGIGSAVWKDKLIDNCIKVITNVMLSFPGFWLGILMILLFAETLNWLPTSGTGGVKHMVMPAAVLSCATTATVARLTRSALLAEFGKQYFIAANAKGISKYRLIIRNALPNAIIPVVTLLGNYLGGILGGSVVIETIFALPGVGSYAINAISGRDYPALQGYVLLTGFLYVGISLVVDMINIALNPRIRIGGSNL
ncbi:ABC transporter permease [Clostridium sp. MSJ-4]|uniref:ABC transporter permease n=1 Tax=Clostridium simiarum TaxID=2841506 RepID=A0ABS6F6E9_9CLOT|nr:ABC transporter permease [Clostridium simiarum]MBU5593183.1 ABC transporter permease [Clostridium simiarum]